MSIFTEKYNITQRLLTTPSKRRSGIRISGSVKFIVAHDTGNPGSTAANNVAYYERSRNEMSASAHIFVDDKEIIECIPALTTTPEKAWHVLYNTPTDNQLFGANANDAAIGVEYCYGNSINADEAYRKFIWVMAKICHVNNLDPASSIVGHHILDPARKTDPVTGLLRSRRTYEQLLRDVVIEFNECIGIVHNPPPPTSALKIQLRVTHRLNLRANQPSTKAPVVRVLNAGSLIDAAGYTDTGEPINGNPKWYFDKDGNYFWSGATTV